MRHGSRTSSKSLGPTMRCLQGSLTDTQTVARDLAVCRVAASNPTYMRLAEGKIVVAIGFLWIILRPDLVPPEGDGIVISVLRSRARKRRSSEQIGRAELHRQTPLSKSGT